VPAFCAGIVMIGVSDSYCQLATLGITNCLFRLQVHSRLQEKCFTDLLISTLIIGIRLDSFHHSKENVILLDSSKSNPPLYSF
jgi:hypothetical protein